MILHIVNNDFEPATIVAKVVMYPGDSRAIIFSNNDVFVESLEKGIYNPVLKREVTPEDGFSFMSALPYEFKSGYYGIIEVEG